MLEIPYKFRVMLREAAAKSGLFNDVAEGECIHFFKNYQRSDLTNQRYQIDYNATVPNEKGTDEAGGLESKTELKTLDIRPHSNKKDLEALSSYVRLAIIMDKKIRFDVHPDSTQMKLAGTECYRICDLSEEEIEYIQAYVNKYFREVAEAVEGLDQEDFREVPKQ